MTAPLDGLTVVEVGPRRAGAFAGAMLADLGARVIKLEAPANRLLARPDVLIDEITPARGTERGLDAAELVRCSISPFGPGPAGTPVTDPVQALSGDMDLIGETGGPPFGRFRLPAALAILRVWQRCRRTGPVRRAGADG